MESIVYRRQEEKWLKENGLDDEGSSSKFKELDEDEGYKEFVRRLSIKTISLHMKIEDSIHEMEKAIAVDERYLKRNGFDSEVKEELEELTAKKEAANLLLDLSIIVEDDYHLVEWLFNDGEYRTQSEINELLEDKRLYDVKYFSNYRTEMENMANVFDDIAFFFWLKTGVINIGITALILSNFDIEFFLLWFLFLTILLIILDYPLLRLVAYGVGKIIGWKYGIKRNQDLW